MRQSWSCLKDMTNFDIVFAQILLVPPHFCSKLFTFFFSYVHGPTSICHQSCAYLCPNPSCPATTLFPSQTWSHCLAWLEYWIFKTNTLLCHLLLFLFLLDKQGGQRARRVFTLFCRQNTLNEYKLNSGHDGLQHKEI